jgi:ribosomal protein L37AE/L43A
MTDTKPCPCGHKMIRRYAGYVSYWWCGGCGHTEDGGVEHGKTEDELAMAEWQEAQGDDGE